MKTITFKLLKRQAYPVSCNLYGAFLEDINFTCDGGLNANKVVNASFDGLYYDKATGKALPDPLRFWKFEGTEGESIAAGQISPNSRFLSFYVKEAAGLCNLGYNGHDQYAGKAAMSIEEGHGYEFSCRIRGNFKGTVTVWVEADDATRLTSDYTFTTTEEWREVKTVLRGIGTEYGKLCFSFVGHGYIDLDLVSLMDDNYWGKGDPKWSAGKIRRDLVEAIADMKPRFLRFPGGSIVEGRTPENEYQWKDTVGPLIERKTNYNLWGASVPEGSYSQSNEIGFYEYLCLCEDLKMEPLPTLSVGRNLQQQKDADETLSAYFEQKVIENYLDLIEFCKGKPEENRWARLRADMGHPEPFGLHMIGVGNENYGPLYLNRFERIAAAIHAVHPEIRLIMSGGSGLMPFAMSRKWQNAKTLNPGGWIDQHLYRTPRWFQRHHHRFDRYERCSSKFIVSEFSANRRSIFRNVAPEKANTFRSALSEAAFLTSVERNADVVDMISYAPLINMVGGTQWPQALLDFSPRYVMRTANYQVMKEFSTHFGENFIPIKASLPRGVVASASMDIKKIYLKVVNLTNATYGADIYTPEMTHIVLSAGLGTRNHLGYRGEPVQPIVWKEGFVNPPRDEYKGHKIKRENDPDKQTLSVLLPHSVNLFVMDK